VCPFKGELFYRALIKSLFVIMGKVKYKKGETEFEMSEKTFKQYIKPAQFRRLIGEKESKWYSTIWKRIIRIMPFIPKIIAVFNRNS